MCLPWKESSKKKAPRDPPSSKLVSDVAKPPLCLRLNRRWFRPPGDIRGGDEMETDVQRTLGVQTFGVNCIAFSLFSYICWRRKFVFVRNDHVPFHGHYRCKPSNCTLSARTRPHAINPTTRRCRGRAGGR